jgi:drug/metabolite transporter (DMT)-like permease
MPVFGPVLAVVILGKTLGPAQIAGGLCVLAGIALVNRPPRMRHVMRRDGMA